MIHYKNGLMRIPSSLSSAFGQPFQERIARFASAEKLLPSESELSSPRYLARAVVPHVHKLSQLFNRLTLTPKDGPKEAAPSEEGLPAYWAKSSHPAHLRAAYFLYFMPCNLYRVAAVWSELSRLGFKWPFPAKDPLRAIEWGAGPASGACGIAAGEQNSPLGLPRAGNWALIEQNRPMLLLGSRWASEYFSHTGVGDWGTRTFNRKVDFNQDLLPKNAPRFHLWLMSFFLNESSEPVELLARRLLDGWNRHLEEEGVIILIEPALKAQSRRLLELRRALLERIDAGGANGLQILLPCLGHQACGALANSEDWCHEEVSWWRPPYIKAIDELAGLDHKSLPFSYLVLIRSRRPREEILPSLASSPQEQRYRLVSPAHAQGKELEFFVCGQEGKRRARYRPPALPLASPLTSPPTSMDPVAPQKKEKPLERGDVLLGAELRGEAHASRVQTLKNIG